MRVFGVVHSMQCANSERETSGAWEKRTSLLYPRMLLSSPMTWHEDVQWSAPTVIRYVEDVRLAAPEIRHVVLKSRSANGTSEVIERRFEDSVVVVVDGDGLLRGDDAQGLNAHGGIHSQQHAEDARAAKMQQRQIDISRYYPRTSASARMICARSSTGCATW